MHDKLEWVRSNVVGFTSRYTSQLSLELEAIYVDHTATNRPFKTIEKMVEYSRLYSANPLQNLATTEVSFPLLRIFDQFAKIFLE